MKYLAIDYGAKYIGIAVSNEEGTIAFPRTVFPNDAKILESITSLVREERIEAIVIGDTRAFSGAENPITPESESFARALSQKTNIQVQPALEAWSSFEAARFAPEGKKDNAAEAAVILQRFLDMRKS